jgi:phi13 family phage major tail protein
MTGTDGSSLPAYGTPKPLTPSAKIQVDPTTNKVPYYADGFNQEMAQIITEGKIVVQGSALPLAVQADLFGHILDGMGGLICTKNDIAPYVAIFYRRQKVNKKYRYVKLYKCLFEDPSDAAATANATVTPQDDTLNGTFYSRIYDGNWKKIVDDEAAGYIDVSSTFFSQVDGAIDVTAPTVSSTTPAANATAVNVATTYAWVFSKSLNPSTVSLSNFYVINDTTGVPVAGTVAYVDATKTVTFTPTSSLSAATKYQAVADIDITDIPGNHLAYSEKFFTTA